MQKQSFLEEGHHVDIDLQHPGEKYDLFTKDQKLLPWFSHDTPKKFR